MISILTDMLQTRFAKRDGYKEEAMGRVYGKVAVIMGSTGGIGRASAELLAREGAKVVVTGRREERGNEVVNGIRESGGEAIFVKTDVTSEADIVKAIDTAISEYGKLDILVNCVGGAKVGMIHELTADDWDYTMGIDAKPVFLAMKHALPHMMEQKSGSIINISSTAINISIPRNSLYNFSKCGVNALTRNCAVEYAQYGIRCNIVSPGYSDTEILSHLTDEQKAGIAASLPFKRMATAEENAYAVLFLASDEASYVSGRGIDVNGAWAL